MCTNPKKIFLIALVVMLCASILHVAPINTVASSTQFQNPINGAVDPFIIKDGNFYYHVLCDGYNRIYIGKSQTITDPGTMRLVYEFPAGQWNSYECWGPASLFKWTDGKWYIYYCASNGSNVNHRVGVLQANTSDPQGAYTDLGQVNTGGTWAISASPFQDFNGNWYITWSGVEAPNAEQPQCTFIAPMTNPWTIGNRVKISDANQTWENSVQGVQEGQIVIRKNNKLFLIYSANASWTDEYCLGMLTYSGGDVLKASNWVKSSAPVFKKTTNVKGPGGPAIIKSADGTQDWLIYHANRWSNSGWLRRNLNAKRFTWDANGNPVFGTPPDFGTLLNLPSGDPGYKAPLAIGVGSDNKPRILWAFADGKVTLWRMNTTGTAKETEVSFGPFNGWKPVTMAVGHDNKARILWSQPSGKISLWTIKADMTDKETACDYGPFTGWDAISMDVGQDNKPRILWSHTDGKASLWTFSTDGATKESSFDHGPHAGWGAGAVAVGFDNKPRIMWNSGSRISLWTMSTNGQTQEAAYEHNIGNGWYGKSLAVGADNKARILWTHANGKISLWTTNVSGSAKESSADQGAFADWFGVSVAVGYDNKPRINWSYMNQKISLWTMSTNGTVKEYATDFQP